MNSTTINDILNTIETQHQDKISGFSNHYIEVDIGKKAAELGDSELGKQYENVFAIIPIKEPVNGMKVLIDGRTFVGYAQFESGLVTPGYVAEASNLTFKPYTASESMILNFA